MKNFGLKISDTFEIKLFDRIDTVKSAIQELQVGYYSNIKLEQKDFSREQLKDVSVVIMSKGVNLEIKLTDGEVTFIRSYESKLNSLNVEAQGIQPVELMKLIKTDVIEKFGIENNLLRLLAYDVNSSVIKYSTPYFEGNIEIKVAKGKHSWYIEYIQFTS